MFPGPRSAADLREFSFTDSLDFNDGDGSALLLIRLSSSPSLRSSNAFLALSLLRPLDYSRLEDAITGSTIDARVSRGFHHGLTQVGGQQGDADIVGNLRGEVDRGLRTKGGEKPVQSLLLKLFDFNC